MSVQEGKMVSFLEKNENCDSDLVKALQACKQKTLKTKECLKARNF